METGLWRWEWDDSLASILTIGPSLPEVFETRGKTRRLQGCSNTCLLVKELRKIQEPHSSSLLVSVLNSYKQPHEHWAFSKWHLLTNSGGRCVTQVRTHSWELQCLSSILSLKRHFHHLKLLLFFFFFLMEITLIYTRRNSRKDQLNLVKMYIFSISFHFLNLG